MEPVQSIFFKFVGQGNGNKADPTKKKNRDACIDERIHKLNSDYCFFRSDKRAFSSSSGTSAKHPAVMAFSNRFCGTLSPSVRSLDISCENSR